MITHHAAKAQNITQLGEISVKKLSTFPCRTVADASIFSQCLQERLSQFVLVTTNRYSMSYLVCNSGPLHR